MREATSRKSVIRGEKERGGEELAFGKREMKEMRGGEDGEEWRRSRGGEINQKIMVQCRWKDAGRVYYEAPREAGHGIEVKSHDIELIVARGEAERRREEGVDA